MHPTAKAAADKGVLGLLIMRTWFKCLNPDCMCVWYDDADNSFNGCPECGGEFYILEEEISPNHPCNRPANAGA